MTRRSKIDHYGFMRMKLKEPKKPRGVWPIERGMYDQFHKFRFLGIMYDRYFSMTFSKGRLFLMCFSRVIYDGTIESSIERSRSPNGHKLFELFKFKGLINVV